MDLLPDVRQLLTGYLKDLKKVFGADLRSVILFGSAIRGEYLPERSNINLLVVLPSMELSGLQRYAKEHRRWKPEGIVLPLFLTAEELSRMAHVFPLEYSEMQEHHLVLWGEELLEKRTIDPRRLLQQCQQEISGNLIRLRQRLVEGGASPEAMGILLPLSITALAPCLRGLLRLNGRSSPGSTSAVLDLMQAELAIDLSALKEVWNLKQALISPGLVELPRLFERYSTTLAALAEKVQSMKEPTA